VREIVKSSTVQPGVLSLQSEKEKVVSEYFTRISIKNNKFKAINQQLFA